MERCEPSYVAFVDLVKVFEKVNHNRMLKILKRYRSLPQLCRAIKIMYRDLKVVLKIGKVKEAISKTVGVRQGVCMAPVLFLFMMTEFVESLEKGWDKSRLDMIELRQQTHSSRDCGQLTNHKQNKLSEGNLLPLFCMLYVNNGACIFTTREQLKTGMSLIYSHFKKFRFEMHFRRGPKVSKTEFVVSRPLSFADKTALHQTHVTTSTNYQLDIKSLLTIEI